MTRMIKLSADVVSLGAYAGESLGVADDVADALVKAGRADYVLTAAEAKKAKDAAEQAEANQTDAEKAAAHAKRSRVETAGEASAHAQAVVKGVAPVTHGTVAELVKEAGGQDAGGTHNTATADPTLPGAAAEKVAAAGGQDAGGTHETMVKTSEQGPHGTAKG